MVNSIQPGVIKFVSDLRQVSGFLLVLRFPPPIKSITNLQLQAQIHHLASRSSPHSSPMSGHNQSQTLFNELSQLSPSHHQSDTLLSPTTPPPDSSQVSYQATILYIPY
jgi:hypothetical protein